MPPRDKPEASFLRKRTKAAATSSRSGRVSVTSWQTPETRRQLKMLAADVGQTEQAMIAEAFNLLFVKYGKPPIAQS
jgi:hypothetical protein